MEEQNQQKIGRLVEGNTIADLEKERLLSEINRNKAEVQKFAVESRWYAKYLLAGIIAGGLLTVWFVGYFQPILNKKQELAKLEIQSLTLKNQIIQTEIKQQAKLLSEENKKIKNDYAELISQNKILEKEQQKLRVSSEELRKDLKKTKDLYSELSKKYNLSLDERKKYTELVKKSDEKIHSLNKEIKQLKTAQEETASRTDKLSEKYVTFGAKYLIADDGSFITTDDGKRIIIEEGKPVTFGDKKVTFGKE